jgi:hypothetical protein
MVFDGVSHVLERAVRTDFALVRAVVADTVGNLAFLATARNFEALAARSCAVTIVEAEEFVDAGELDPDRVHVRGAFTQRLVVVPAGTPKLDWPSGLLSWRSSVPLLGPAPGAEWALHVHLLGDAAQLAGLEPTAIATDPSRCLGRTSGCFSSPTPATTMPGYCPMVCWGNWHSTAGLPASW